MTHQTALARAEGASGSANFRVGRVAGFRRGRVWYLRYFEQGRRYQPRVGQDRAVARQRAAEIHAQLEVGAPSALGFEPISIVDLRQRWLDHHEFVRRSSLATIRRYRAATQHLVNFVIEARPLRRASDFRTQHAEEFARYLRTLHVAPNGHPKAARRPLRDSGVRFILETCCTLFHYAQRHRHLPPYAENPFGALEVGRIPIEDARPITAFDLEQEVRLLRACDEWQFPLVLTLLWTGLRPGELVHLLLPQDLDLKGGWLHVRNKPALGWQVKTRNERDVPLMTELAAVLRAAVGPRSAGPVFRQRRCSDGYEPPLAGGSRAELEAELGRRLVHDACPADGSPRAIRQAVAKTVWRDLGALKEDWVRKEFMQLTRAIGLPEITAPKTLRHTFATTLQDANVDPLIRNELMGHAPMATVPGRGSLGMTAVYTHTRPETKRCQLEMALRHRPAVGVVREWLQRHGADVASAGDDLG